MKLLLACGGTGGHIFPALSVAEEIERRHARAAIVYVLGKKDIESTILRGAAPARVLRVGAAPFRGPLSLMSPVFLIKLVSSFFSAAGHVVREKPDLVVGFGGYVSFPVVLAARLLGRRALIHEQNVVPGAANRFLARVASGVALSHPQTREYLPWVRHLRITGNPIRASIEKDFGVEAFRFFGFSREKITILVLGGSQGAQTIDTFFPAAVESLEPALKEEIQILHLSGHMPAEAVEDGYRRLGVPAKAYGFFDRMELAYAVADFAVGRAGATFLAEIEAKGIPAILVPYPFGSGHQRWNAEAASRKGMAVVIAEKDLNAEKLKIHLEDFIRRSRGARGTPRSETTGARERLADFVMEFVRGMG